MTTRDTATSPFPEGAGRDDEPITTEIGPRLRMLRHERGVSLRDLAARLGISASALSQIENGRMLPSVNRLVTIMAALDLPLAFAFGGEGSGPEDVQSPGLGEVSVARAGEIEPIVLSTGVVYERLTPRPMPSLELFRSTYPPGSASSPPGEFLRHPGFESGHMLAGAVTVEYDDGTAYPLGEGDAISHPATRPHRIANRSAQPAVILWLTVH
jgi:transcriptional regulator with XRE-family HTH domain